MPHVETINNSRTLTNGIKTNCNGRFWSDGDGDQFKCKDDASSDGSSVGSDCGDDGWMI